MTSGINKGLSITKGHRKTSALMRFSHESVSKETAVMIVTVRPSLCRWYERVPSGIKTGATVAMICRRNVHCSGTGHSSSVAHTAEGD